MNDRYVLSTKSKYLWILVDEVELDNTKLHCVIKHKLENGLKVPFIECCLENLFIDLLVLKPFFLQLFKRLKIREGTVLVPFQHNVDRSDHLKNQAQNSFLECSLLYRGV